MSGTGLRTAVRRALCVVVCLLLVTSAPVGYAEPKEPPVEAPPPLELPILPDLKHAGPAPVGPRAPARPLRQDKAPDIKFPCKLELPKGKKEMPKIVLVGEKHGSPDAIDAHKELKERAKGGKCYVGLEGIYCVDDKPPVHADVREDFEQLAKDNILGYDDPLTHAFSGIMVYYMRISAHMKSPETIFARQDLLGELADLDFMKRAWKFTRAKKLILGTADSAKDVGDDSEKEIVDLFDKLVEATPREAKKIIDNLVSKEPDHAFLTDDHAMLSILKAWLRGFGRMVAALPDAEKAAHSVPSNLAEHIEDFARGRNPNSAFHAITLEWRNQFMAINLARAYCKALAAGVDLFVTTGEAHVPGLQELLTGASKKAGTTLVVDAKNARDFRGAEREAEDRVLDALKKRLEDLGKKKGLMEPPIPFGPLPDPGKHGGKTPPPPLAPKKTMLKPEAMHVDSYVRGKGDEVRQVTWVIDGIRYTVWADELATVGGEVLAKKGSLSIHGDGNLSADPGRRKYALRLLEEEISAHPEGAVAKLVTPLGLPKASSLSGPEKSGPSDPGRH